MVRRRTQEEEEKGSNTYMTIHKPTQYSLFSLLLSPFLSFLSLFIAARQMIIA